MAASRLICGFRRAFGAMLAAWALCLAFTGTAFADHGNGADNGNGCQAPGNAYGHDNCDGSSVLSAPPASGDSTSPASEPAPPPSVPADDPNAGGQAAEQDSPAVSPDVADSESSSDPTEPSTSIEQEATPPSASRPYTPSAPSPGAPAAGWTPVVARPERPAASPAPPPAAARARTFSSASAPEASWGSPDASWSQGKGQSSLARFGVTGTSAIVAIRRGAGVAGGLAFRVQMIRGHSTFAFRASRSIVAGAGGRLYRIRTWLRSDVPGLNVCLRIQEVSPRDTLSPVRTSESCFAPTAKWKQFRLYRRTLDRGNRLIFSIYSYGAVEGDSFDVDRFTVSHRVKNGWKRVTAAFGKPTDSA
jgi:hypothetical protein